MKLNKKQLPFYAAFVQTAQYTLAGWLFMGLIGAVCVGLMGSLVSLAMAYATSQFSDIAQKRKGASALFLVALMSFSPILIGTATFIHLEQVTNLIWRGVVCAAWGFLPDGATALAGFIAGKGLVEQSEKKPLKVAQVRSAKKKVRSADFTCRYAGAGCERKFASQNSANAHARTCGFKPTISMPIEVKNGQQKN